MSILRYSYKIGELCLAQRPLKAESTINPRLNEPLLHFTEPVHVIRRFQILIIQSLCKVVKPAQSRPFFTMASHPNLSYAKEQKTAAASETRMCTSCTRRSRYAQSLTRSHCHVACMAAIRLSGCGLSQSIHFS